MTMRQNLCGLALAVTSFGTVATAQEPDEATKIYNYRCEGYGLVQVDFGGSLITVVVDGQSQSLSLLEELPGGTYLYTGDRLAMVVGNDNLFIGPRLDWGGAVVHPTSECNWES